MEQYTITFQEYYDLPGFTGDITIDEAYAEYQRLFKTEDGTWDEAKVYAARVTYVEQHRLDPTKYHVCPWDLSTWKGHKPQPQPSPYLRRKALTCEALARQKRWDQSMCCQECHGDSSLLIERIVCAKNPLKKPRRAMVCCSCINLLSDWYPGQIVAQLPEHE